MSKLRTRKLVLGIGINDSDYNTQPIINGKQVRCKYYNTWTNMLKRCYDPKYQAKHHTYIGCTVTEEWLIFSNFKAWMETQDYEGKQLDKDILVRGNRIYSPNTCIFVSNTINLLFTKSDAARGEYKIGVSFKKENGKYLAQCQVNSKTKYLGLFLTEEEAYQTYKIFKTSHIRTIALEQSDSRLREAMLNYVVE